jgi:LPS-assembly protein
MKNNYLENRTINYNNIFDINRLGLDDTLESGSSLTMGVDFKKESLQDINKYFEFKLGTIIRDKNNNNIPLTSGITKKRSNYFGNINNNFNENIDINYDFSINSDLDKLEYNSLGLGYKNDTFRTRFNFIEESGVIGSSNILENKTSLILNENNNLLFETRQNRKINLTEYYNLIYEYKNDCLVAGITYNKTYYEDRDLQPSENLMFKLTLIPITSIGQSIKN